MLFKLSVVALALASTVSAAYPPARSAYVHSEQLAPIISSTEAEIIPDSYFVVFKSGVLASDHSAWVHELADVSASGCHGSDEKSSFSGVKHVYDMGDFQGLAGQFHPDVLSEIRKNPDVSFYCRQPSLSRCWYS